MSMESQLVDLIKSLMESQAKQHEESKAANKEVVDSLAKLRENVHQIKNDYQGQSQLVKIIYKDVEEMKHRQDRDNGSIHERIDKHDAKFESAIEDIRQELATIAPLAESFGKIRDHAVKVIVGAATIAIIVLMGAQLAGG